MTIEEKKQTFMQPMQGDYEHQEGASACFYESINLEKLVGSASLKTKLKNILLHKVFYVKIGPGI